MKEAQIDSGQMTEEESSQDQSIISYFKNLKAKYTVPGDYRPGRGYYLIVAFWITMICWWVFSTIIMLFKVNGSLLEGTAGFVLMLVERVGFITLGVTALVRWKSCSLKKYNWKFWLAAIGLAFGSFLILRNPVRDIPYLSRPAEVSLHKWSMNSDTDLDDAAVYSLWGKDESEQLMNFYINESTLDDVAEFPENIELKVTFLPYTKTVMSISM